VTLEILEAIPLQGQLTQTGFSGEFYWAGIRSGNAISTAASGRDVIFQQWKRQNTPGELHLCGCC